MTECVSDNDSNILLQENEGQGSGDSDELEILVFVDTGGKEVEGVKNSFWLGCPGSFVWKG